MATLFLFPLLTCSLGPPVFLTYLATPFSPAHVDSRLLEDLHPLLRAERAVAVLVGLPEGLAQLAHARLHRALLLLQHEEPAAHLGRIGYGGKKKPEETV